MANLRRNPDAPVDTTVSAVPLGGPGQGGLSTDLAQEIRALRELLERHADDPSAKIGHVRQHQRIHLRSYQKYPDVIEVGINMWEAMYDWHVRMRHPIRMIRNADGRYEMTFIDTRIILRPDLEPTHVGLGYDGSAPPPALP